MASELTLIRESCGTRIPSGTSTDWLLTVMFSSSTAEAKSSFQAFDGWGSDAVEWEGVVLTAARGEPHAASAAQAHPTTIRLSPRPMQPV